LGFLDDEPAAARDKNNIAVPAARDLELDRDQPRDFPWLSVLYLHCAACLTACHAVGEPVHQLRLVSDGFGATRPTVATATRDCRRPLFPVPADQLRDFAGDVIEPDLPLVLAAILFERALQPVLDFLSERAARGFAGFY